jgi:tRNA (adenine-N(1)-)-methyltransferase non-catalytic subunit
MNESNKNNNNNVLFICSFLRMSETSTFNSPSDSFLSVGSNFLFDSGRSRRFFHSSSSSTVHSLKSLSLPFSVDFAPLVGAPFGSTFEVEEVEGKFALVRKRRHPTNESENQINQLINASSSSTVFSDPNFIPSANNSTLYQSSSTQHLSTSSIESLKSSVKPSLVIEQLVQGSATFKQKTEFSQEKYIKKKKKKFAAELKILNPNVPLNLIETFQLRDPQKIQNLRVDTLSHIMNLCNIASGSRCIIHEQNPVGLIAGIALQRLSGQGILLSACTGEANLTRYEAFRRMNLSSKQMSTFHELSVHSMASLAREPLESEQSLQSEFYPILLRSGFDSLIISARADFFSLFFFLWRFLLPSAAFVVHCQFIEPLALLHERLKGIACSVQLAESWMRDYQVLPNRTHPAVSMNSNSGYWLSGYKIAEEPKHSIFSSTIQSTGT